MATFIPVESVEEDELTSSFVPLEEVEDDAVEQDVPRGTPAVPRRRSAAPLLADALQRNNLFGSATSALQGARDKGIRRKEDGDWDLPLMEPQVKGDFLDEFVGGISQAATTVRQKTGARLDDAGDSVIDKKAIQKVFHDFQQANNLSDDEVAAAWQDLGNQNRAWEEGEHLRIQSDGDLLPNPNSPVWLDPEKAKEAVNAADVSDEAKAAALKQLPQLATNLAAEKLGAYEAAATSVEAIADANPAGALGAKALEGFEPPSAWAAKRGRTDVGTPQFILDYEADVMGRAGWTKEKLWGLAGKLVLSGNKLATQTLGTLGTLGVDAAGELAAEGSEGAATVNRGLPETGLLGSAVEESLPIGSQILTGRGFAAFGKGMATLGTFATAGAQSAGLTFAEQLADGATEEEAREKALKAGLSTAIITSMFGTGTAGGVERAAVGAADDVTVGQLITMAGERGIREVAKSPELRKFAGTVVASAAGEGAEEGIDQLLGAFLTADPDTPLADAWEQASQAFKVGAVIGGGVDVAMNMAQNAPLAAAAVVEDSQPTNENTEDAPPTPDAPQAAAAAADDDVPALNPDEQAPLPEQPQDPPEAVTPPADVVEGEVEPVEDLTDENEAPPLEALPAPEPLEEAGGASFEPVAEVDQESPPSPAVGDVPVQDDSTYSKDRLRETFDLTPEQADATDALVQAMGLDVSRIKLKRGGVPGEGLNGESETDGARAAYDDAQGRWMDSDELRSRSGKPSPQGIKGSFETIAETGDMLLRGLTNPDVSTAIHELSHVARRTLFDRNTPVAGLTPEDIEVAELWAGAKDGKWDVKAEEKFARGFEKYMRDGEAPNAELATVFEKIGNWLKGIYQSLKGTPLDVQITPAMRRVFDNLVTRTLPDKGTADTGKQPDSGTTGETRQPLGAEPVLTEENEQAPSEPAPEPDEIAPSELPPEGTPDSPTPEDDLTSVKNAATDVELAKHGFEPIAAPAKKALGESWDEALARLQRNPNAGNDLVDELNTKPRATSDVEHGVLLKTLADRKLIYGQAQARLADIEASGDEAQVAEARREAELARDAVYKAITAAKATGTVWGRAGRFRQLAIDSDYSLVQMEASYRTEVNGGKPLTGDQAAEVKRLHDEIAAAKKELDDYKDKAAKEIARKVHEATLATLRKAKPKLRKALGSKIEEAKKKLKDAGLIAPDADAEFLAQEALPEDILDAFATIAAGWQIDRDLSDGQFADQLRKLGGEKATAHAEAIRQRSREIIDASIDETFREMDDSSADAGGEKTTRARKPKTVEGILEDIDPEEGLDGNTVFQIARIHIRNGVDGFENVMQATLESLQEVFPDLDLRQLHDAYSGYGKTVFPSKEADLTKLREYRTLARLTSQLEDAMKAQAPKRTGMQRDKPSERVRTLQKQVKEMMRKMGIQEVSDDQRLKSSLDAVKTRLKNEIEELEVAIRDRQPRPDGKSQVEYDQEAYDLKVQRDKLRDEYQNIFGKKELTDEDRIRMTVKALERRIEETGKLIAAGKGKRDKANAPKVSSPEIEALRAKLGGLNEQRNALRDREAERLERTKKITQNRIEKLRKRVAAGDYAPAAKLPPVKPDTELGRLQKIEIDLKREFNERLLAANRAKRSRGAKIYDAVIEVFNASRSIITSADVSAVLRQGGFIALGNPLRALKAIPAMFKAGFSEDFAQALASQIESNPYFVQSQKAKLFLSEFGDTHHFTKMEESFRGRLAKKIPGIGKVVSFSERTYTAFLNKIRMDTFEAMAKSVSPTGDLTADEAKVIANFINVATGRGNLERYDKAAEALAAAFFSPKYVVSRFQLLAQPLTGFSYGTGSSWRTRKAIATEYGKTLAGAAMIYSLVALSKMMLDDEDDEKVTVERDPRSSDFGKIKIGNTRIDPLFGLLQATVLISRLSTGKTKGADGEVVPLRGEGAAFGKSPAGVFGQFVRTKLAPVPSAVVNMIDGEDVVGNKVYWETELIGNLMPLSTGDIYTTMQEQGIPAGTAMSILALFGAGMSTYGDDEDKPMEQQIMTTFFGVDPERYED